MSSSFYSAQLKEPLLYGLMYSGGVDSIVCLKILRDQGITPVLFHFQYESLRKKFRHIKKVAKLLSPESPLYVWKIPRYQAGSFGNGEFWVDLSKNKSKVVMPERWVDKLVIGYFEKDIMDNKYLEKSCTCWTGEALKKYLYKDLKLVFPLAKMSRLQIEKIWRKLPREVRINTVTSSRNYTNEHTEWIVVE